VRRRRRRTAFSPARCARSLLRKFPQDFLGLSRALSILHASLFGLLRAVQQLACQPAPVVVFLHHFYASRLLSLYLYPQHFYMGHKYLHRA
jgi:hypothetical protein